MKLKLPENSFTKNIPKEEELKNSAGRAVVWASVLILIGSPCFADGSKIVQPNSHNIEVSNEIARLDKRLDEVNKTLSAGHLSSSEKRLLRKEKKDIKERKSRLLIEKNGITSGLNGTAIYEK